MRIALASCTELPEGDGDDMPLAARLGADWAVWDDPGVDWSAYDRVLPRATWDYSGRRDEFLEWARGLGDRLLNPYPVIAWNTDKRYLAELRAARLPVVPTIFVAPGGALPRLEAEVVVKPTVSAGSRDTARFTADDERAAQALMRFIHRSGRDAMVQPYLRSVDARGETALLFFGGAFSHAITKGPLLRPGGRSTNSFFAPETVAARAPTPAESAVAARVVAWLAERFGAAPAYARIDLVEGPGGGPLVLEVEVTEPSLFFRHAPDAVERFAAVLLRS